MKDKFNKLNVMFRVKSSFQNPLISYIYLDLNHNTNGQKFEIRVQLVRNADGGLVN